MKIIYLNFVPADYRAAVQLSQYIEATFNDLVTDSTQNKSDWNTITQAIARSDIFLYLISPDAIQDEQWQRQLDHALHLNIHVQAILVSETDMLFPALGDRPPIDLSRDITDTHLRELDQAFLLFRAYHLPLFTDWRQLTVAVIITGFLLVVLVVLIFPSDDGTTTLPTLTPISTVPTPTIPDCMTLAPFASGDDVIVIRISGVYLYDEPDLDSERLLYIPSGSNLTLGDEIQCIGDRRWFHVRANDRSGWVVESDSGNVYLSRQEE